MKFPVSIMILLILLASIGLVAINTEFSYDSLDSMQYISPENGNIKLTSTLYFVYDHALRKESRSIVVDDKNYDQVIILNLSYGSKNSYFKTIYDKGVNVNSVDLINNTCYVNIDKTSQFDALLLDVDFPLYIWSIVNSLTENSHIKNVQILIDGKQFDYPLNGFNLNEPLNMNTKLVYYKVPTAADIVLDFLENINLRRFDLAYNLLDKKSQEFYAYSDFITYANKFINLHNDFQRDTIYTRVYSDFQEVFIKFAKQYESDGFMLNTYDKWRVVKEDDIYRINMTND